MSPREICPFFFNYSAHFAELLAEVSRREKEAGVFPEADVDLFMKVDISPFKIYFYRRPKKHGGSIVTDILLTSKISAGSHVKQNFSKLLRPFSHFLFKFLIISLFVFLNTVYSDGKT